jgi:multidrug efflux system membrane fusion protein
LILSVGLLIPKKKFEPTAAAIDLEPAVNQIQTDDQAPKARRKIRRRFMWLGAGALIYCFVVVTAGLLWGKSTSHSSPTATAPAAILVTIADATYQDVPLYLAGLGNIQASNTTAVHTQVDGKLQSVNFVEGREVHKGDVLAQIDPRLYQAALDQAKAKKAQDEAQLVSAKKDLARYQVLAAKNFDTQQNLDHQIALVGQTEAAIEADQAAIESAQTQLDYTTIRSPVDGRIGIRQVDPGNIVHVTDTTPIVIVTQTRPIAVVFTLPEHNLSDVRQAMQKGPVAVQAYDQNAQQPLATGKLLLIDNQIDQTTSTLRLKAIFPNEDDVLWPGEFVHVRVLADTRKQVIVIPSVAVQRGPQGLYAWVVKSDSTVEVRPIQVGPTQNGVTIINSGVSSGDQVVVNGQSRLRPGSHVAPHSAPASGSGASS